ncbi:EpsG family protein [Dyadobacter sp. CY261]|nr:EpsG family protein [Dyadobacter sp. CY261]
MLFLLSAIRSPKVGTDTSMYVNIFKSVEAYFRDIEPGYSVLMSVTRSIENDSQFFLFITSCFIFFPVYFFIIKKSQYPLYSLLLFVLLFYYYFSLSGLRQAIATSILLLSYVSLTERKYILWGSLVLGAASFHTTAIMFLPISFLLNRYPIQRSSAIVILLLSFALGWGGLIDIRKFVTILDSTGLNLGLYIDLSKYYTYAEYSFGENVNTTNAKIFNMVPNTMVCILLIYFSDKKLANPLSFFLMGTVITNLFVDIPIAFRIAYYFTIFQIVAIPNTLIKSRYHIIVRSALTVIWAAIFVFETEKKVVYHKQHPGRNDVVPYEVF